MRIHQLMLLGMPYVTHTLYWLKYIDYPTEQKVNEKKGENEIKNLFRPLHNGNAHKCSIKEIIDPKS